MPPQRSTRNRNHINQSILPYTSCCYIPTGNINGIISKIHQEYAAVQNESYQKELKLRSYEDHKQGCYQHIEDLMIQIEALKQENWKLEKEFKRMEVQLENERRKKEDIL